MSFNGREFSLATGQPVRLYQFARGILRWTYNTSDRDITHLGLVYKSLRGGISDDGIRQTGDASANAIKIIAPGDLEVAQFFRGVPPSDAIDLLVFDRHYGDDDYRASWIGEIQSVNWPDLDRCEITCSPESVSMSGQGLRLSWERPCPHCVFERGCFVDRNPFRVSAMIIATDGATLQSTAFGGYPNGWFNAGYIEYDVGSGVLDRRMIDTHVGNSITLFGGTAGQRLGRVLSAFPGCDQTAQTCNDKFNNLDNQGGFRHLPGRSPYDGNPIW